MHTLGTVDTSLRASLVANIALVGGGSMVADLPARLERQLRDALSPAPWTPRVVASKQRAAGQCCATTAERATLPTLCKRQATLR